MHYTALALLGAEKGAERLCNPYVPGSCAQKEMKSKLATSAMPYGGPKSGQNSHITPAISGVPTIGDKITSNCMTPRRPKLGGIATQPSSSQGLPNKGAKTEMVLAPMPSWEPGVGHKCDVTCIF